MTAEISRISRQRHIAIGLFAVLLAGGVIFTLWSVLRQTEKLVSNIGKPREEQIDLGALVTRVQALNRLETASMRVMHVGTVKQSYEYVPNALAGDEVTLYSAGDVIAGIDLSQLRREDVHREPDGTIVLKLPPPMILITRVDNRETKVIARKTGMFRRADPQLEGRARQYAEQSIRNEATRKGILQLAAQNSELRVGELLHTFGFQRVRFRVVPSAPAERVRP